MKYFIIAFLFLFSSLSYGLESIQSVKLVEFNKREKVKFIKEQWFRDQISIDVDRKVVRYINFWATWCKACEQEIKPIQRINDFFKGPRFETTFVNLDAKKDLNKAKAFWEKEMAPLPIVYWEGGVRDNLVKPDSLPYHIIIDKNGKIAAQFYGSISSDFLEKKITKLIYKVVTE